MVEEKDKELKVSNEKFVTLEKKLQEMSKTKAKSIEYIFNNSKVLQTLTNLIYQRLTLNLQVFLGLKFRFWQYSCRKSWSCFYPIPDIE
jgi:hypothetical protein